MQDKLVSVIMSAYNEKIDWFTQCMEALFNQSYTNIEIILIIDNPSNDEIISVAKNLELKESRLKVVVNNSNLGLVKSLNKALTFVNGDYIARIDADDICIKDRIKIQKEFLDNNPDFMIVGSNALYIDEDNNEISQRQYISTDFNIIKERLKTCNVFIHPSLMFRKEVFEKIGCYREIKFAEDYDLVTRAVAKGLKVTNINERLIKYRVRQNGISKSNNIAQNKSALFVRKNYKKALKGINKNLEDSIEYFDASKYKISDLFNLVLDELQNKKWDFKGE